ncbi:hypothetical protein B7463_g3401, partial [Scytalidium lignicola]
MSFGWSAGDIAECVKLLIKIRTALKDSGGSAAEYQSTVNFLKGVETTVKGVENILQNHPDLSFQIPFKQHVTELITVVTRFRKKTEGYDTSLGANATTSEAKKTWKKIKLALFGHIEELKSDISYPQSVVDNLIGLQTLDILVNMSKKPTLSPQQFEDSIEKILRNFPILVTTIEALRSDIVEDFIMIQQTTESNLQRNFDQIQQNLSDGNILQRSISAQEQAAAEAQALWQSQFQIPIAELRAEAQKYFEALQEMKQAQETTHQHSVQTALQLLSLRNAFQPAASRPVIKQQEIAHLKGIVLREAILKEVTLEVLVLKEVTPKVLVLKQTILKELVLKEAILKKSNSKGAGSQGSNSKGGNSKGAGSQGGNSKEGNSKRASSQAGNSKGGNSKGAGSQGSNSKGKTSMGVSSGGGDTRKFNARGGESSRGGSLVAGRSRGGLPKDTNSRGGGSRRGGPKEASSGSGNSRGGEARRGSSNRGSSGHGNLRGGSIRGRGVAASRNVTRQL